MAYSKTSSSLSAMPGRPVDGEPILRKGFHLSYRPLNSDPALNLQAAAGLLSKAGVVTQNPPSGHRNMSSNPIKLG